MKPVAPCGRDLNSISQTRPEICFTESICKEPGYDWTVAKKEAVQLGRHPGHQRGGVWGGRDLKRTMNGSSGSTPTVRRPASGGIGTTGSTATAKRHREAQEGQEPARSEGAYHEAGGAAQNLREDLGLL